MMSPDSTFTHLPLIETFRLDLSPQEIAAAQVANTRSLATQAYLYAFPAFIHVRQITEFVQGRRYAAPDENPLGGWVLMRALSDAKTDNTLPNVDTLYGAWYLLLDQQGPMVLTVPPIPDRYYSVAMLDAYMNNFAIVSPRTFGNDAGSYLIVPPGWSGEAPAGIRAVFVAPTPAINLYQRIYTHGVGEYPALHKLQDAIRLTPLAQWGQNDVHFAPVDLSPYQIEGMRTTRDPLQFFEYTNRYTGVNPPPVEDAGLAALFKTAGVGPGAALPENPALRAAIAAGAADAQAIINAKISAGPFRNGWRIPDPHVGRAGPYVLTRAVYQMTQMGSFIPEEAIYFFGFSDAEQQPLHGQHNYTLTFVKDGLPPMDKHGFWSLTMYNAQSFLVDNPLNRYILRPDSPGLTFAADGSLTLYLQADRPEGVPEANWLPADRAGFIVALRTYLPQRAIIDGAWFPPAIQRAR